VHVHDGKFVGKRIRSEELAGDGLFTWFRPYYRRGGQIDEEGNDERGLNTMNTSCGTREQLSYGTTGVND